MSDQIDRTSHLRWVPIADTRVSSKAQATFSEARAERIAANFDLEALGYPVVNFRDGHWYIIDGQHRVAALKIMGWGDQQVQCEAYEGLTEEQEAVLFLGRNDKRNPKPLDKFLVALTAGRSDEQDIARTVHAQGLKVGHGAADGTIGAVTALSSVYHRAGPVVLGRALRIIRDAYASDRVAFRPDVIKGLGLVCERYNGALDDSIAVEKLSRLPNGVHSLTAKAAHLRHQFGRSMDDCVAGAVVDTINTGRGGKKLEAWWK